MSQVTFNSASERPGIRSAEIFENLDDRAAAYLLPGGAFKLIATLDPERINGPKRAETLGNLLSVELAVDDPERRKILLNALPASKVGELEDRIGLSIDQLRQGDALEQPVRRGLLGFFGVATVGDRSPAADEPLESVTPERGLFPHQKRAAIAVERFLYYKDGRAMLHLPTGVGKNANRNEHRCLSPSNPHRGIGALVGCDPRAS